MLATVLHNSPGIGKGAYLRATRATTRWLRDVNAKVGGSCLKVALGDLNARLRMQRVGVTEDWELAESTVVSKMQPQRENQNGAQWRRGDRAGSRGNYAYTLWRVADLLQLWWQMQ